MQPLKKISPKWHFHFSIPVYFPEPCFSFQPSSYLNKSHSRPHPLDTWCVVWCMKGSFMPYWLWTVKMAPIIHIDIIIPPASTKLKEGFTGFTLSVCKMSICGQNRVSSVSSTILIGSISYLHILSSNFRRCVSCNVCVQNSKIWNFGKFFKFVTLTLSSFDLGSNITQ